jgi:predicted kinase
MKMTILRGISGSGKSTYATKKYPAAIICSADDYFVSDGEYHFDPTKIAEAHANCFRQAITSLIAGKDVVIDNTNTRIWEMSPYILLAQAFHAQIETIKIECNPEIATKRNTHGTTKHTIFRMYERMEDPLPFWPREIKITLQ